MWDYIGGFLFLLWMIALNYLFGYSVHKTHNFSKNILTGYILYSFLIAIGFIGIELIGLPWKIALIYFFIVILSIVSFIIYAFKKYDLKICKTDIKKMVQENYFLIIVVLILLLISVFSFSIYWLNNHLDDGFYLARIARMPYTENTYDWNYPVNCDSKQALSYKINTWELESSIYVYLLRLNVFAYSRIFLNFFNYLLLCCSVSLISNKLSKHLDFDDNKTKYLQYIACILIVFAINMDIASKVNFMHLMDHWQFVTAMYFGSSIPRTMGILWIILAFFDKEEIKLTDVFTLFIISVVLISKSSIALPIIIVTSVSVFVVVNFKLKFKNLALIISLGILYIILGYVLPNVPNLEEPISNLYRQNMYTLPFVVSAIVVCLSFVFRNKYINRINLILFLILELMLTPEINDVFENASIYNFVANRMFTTLMYTFYIVAFMYASCLIIYFFKKRYIRPIFVLATVVFTFGASITYNYGPSTILHSLNVIVHNRKMVPNSTLQLGNSLNEISNKEGTLRILSPDLAIIDAVYHPVATILSTVTDNTISISAIPRFNVDEEESISKFTQDEQTLFMHFNETKSVKDFEQCLSFIDEFGVNSFILTGDTTNCDQYGHFKKVKVISDSKNNVIYSIYCLG